MTRHNKKMGKCEYCNKEATRVISMKYIKRFLDTEQDTEILYTKESDMKRYCTIHYNEFKSRIKLAIKILDK